MRHIFLTLALSILFTGLYCQSPFSVSAAFGPSFPVGRFEQAGTDTLKKQSAAEPGISTEISIAYQFAHSSFGVSITGGWQQHKVDGPAIAKALASEYPGGQLYAGSNSWHIWKLLIGPTYKFPVAEEGRISLQCGIAGGMMKTSLPDTWRAASFLSGSAYSYSESSPNVKLSSFCYQANTAIVIRVTDAIHVNGNLLFFHSSPSDYEIVEHGFGSATFTGTTFGSISGMNPIPKVRVYYPMSTIDFLIGISYRF